MEQVDGIEIDEQAINLLVILFRRCAEAGLVIPEEMPLDTPVHQRAACLYLGHVLHVYYRGEGDSVA